jgi:hypothetical protein
MRILKQTHHPHRLVIQHRTLFVTLLPLPMPHLLLVLLHVLLLLKVLSSVRGLLKPRNL